MLRRYMKIKEAMPLFCGEDGGHYPVCRNYAARPMPFISSCSFCLHLSSRLAELSEVKIPYYLYHL